MTSAILDVKTYQKYNSSNRIVDYPVNITFAIEAIDFNWIYHQHKVEVPCDTDKWVGPDIYYQMTIFRVEMLKKRLLLTKIYLGKEAFWITFTVNRRPKMEDFERNRYYVDDGKISIFVPSDKQLEDVFVYVAILPAAESLEVNTCTIVNK